MTTPRWEGAARAIGRHRRARRTSVRPVTSSREREFFDRHYLQSLRYAITRFPRLSRAEQEDIVHAAWERILLRLRRADDTNHPGDEERYGAGWVLTFVNWAGLNWLRSTRTRAALLERMPVPEEELHPAHPRLGLCLEQLPDRQLDILLRIEVRGESQQEIADSLGVHRNTVGTQRTMALEALRDCMEANEP